MVRQRPIDPAKVGVYIRWSTDDQAEGTTLDVQLDGCRHYILSQGWEYTEDLLYIDEGYSGGSLDRPAMRALRQAVQQGRVDCVVVFKLDRLSRSVVDTVALVLEEWDGRCYVKSAREPVDTTNHAGKMFFYMLVSYAEWERAVIRERTLAGKLRRAQEGKNPGFKPPYGYSRAEQPGALAVVEAEAAVVRRIYELYRRGAGVLSITHRLNQEGLRFRGGRLWNESTVKKMLANPIYRGDLQYGRRTRNPARAKRSDEPFYLQQEPAVVRSGAVPAVISAKEWEAVQAIRSARPGAARGTSGRAHSSPHLLTGLARCTCGHAVIGYKGGGSKEYYYRCSGQRKKGPAACKCGYIRQDLINEVVLQKFQAEFAGQMNRQQYAERARAEAEAQVRGLAERADAARAALARLEETERRIRRLFREGRLTLEEFREQRADMAADRQDGAGLLASLEAQHQQIRANLALQAEAEGMAERIHDFRSLQVEEQKQILRHFVESVTLYKPRGGQEAYCNVQWKWSAPRSDEQGILLRIED